jgi:flagellar biosynthetic protein FliR
LFDFVNFGADKIQLLLLIVLRASGLFLTAPIFGYKTFSAKLKIALILLLSVLMLPTLNDVSIPVMESEWQLAGLALRELMVGALVGLFFQAIFLAVQSAGALVGYQIGFAMMALFDPNTSDRVSIIGQFWFLLAALIFLAIDGHHILLNSFADSFAVIPPGSFSIAGGVGEMFTKFTSYIFVLAVKIAAPVVMTLFLTDVALGAIAKTMPNMPVFFVGFPVKIVAGLAVIGLSLPIVSFLLQKAVGFVDGELRLMFLAMGKA